jgi:glycosyltransferase involved in cell wall biosynthesis
MNILFLTNAYPDFTSSYRGNFIKEMAAQLKRGGYQISVVTPKIYNNSRYFEEHDDIKVYRFPFFAGNRLLIEYERIPYLRMLFYFLFGSFFTLYVLFKQRPDLIHVHWAIPTGLIGLVAGLLLKIPLIVTIHGSDLRMAMAKPFLLELFLSVCKKARHITCVSEAQERELRGFGINKEKISVFSMAVDEDFLNVRRGEGLRGFCTVLSNRNFLRIYNVSLLIRAIPLVLKEEPNTRFLLAGDGFERGRLEEEAERLKVNPSIRFLGRIPHHEMPELLAKTDIYVSTSLHDGTSVSLLEAMACGAFPIVTDIPSNREWIADGENGFLIPTENEDALAKRIVEAIRNNKLLGEACSKNRKIVEERAHLSKKIKDVTRIYEESVQLV